MGDPIARPAPTARGEERRYFDDVREHRLPFYRCAACSNRTAHPFIRCTVCAGTDAVREWAVGTGVVYSFTEVHRAGSPAFADRVPYLVALVELDEGVRSLADLRLSAYADGAYIGQRVSVGFDDLADGLVLPWFTPVASPR